MVNNYICSQCIHALVCKKREVIDKFQDECKKPLNVSITIDSCEDFEDIK
jgi:hypothetical protein